MSPETIERARLIATELVTNAVLHTDGDRIAVDIALVSDSQVRIAVTDHGHYQPLRPLHVHTDEEYGRGLALVEALADGWGHDPAPHRGTRVWAHLTILETAS